MSVCGTRCGLVGSGLYVWASSPSRWSSRPIVASVASLASPPGTILSRREIEAPGQARDSCFRQSLALASALRSRVGATPQFPAIHRV